MTTDELREKAWSHDDIAATLRAMRTPRPDIFTLIDIDRLAAAFWSRVDITANPDECWIWTGKSHSTGYGIALLNGQEYRAHRVAYALVEQKMPRLLVLHSCDNPPCCNPKHLREGTSKENALEMCAKGRHKYILPPPMRGEDGVFTRLTEPLVLSIREKNKEGRSQNSLAREYGVSRGCIQQITTRRTWRHI